MPTIKDDRHIDIHRITIAKGLWARNAMANNMIDAGADRFWKTTVIQRGWDGAMVTDIVMTNAI